MAHAHRILSRQAGLVLACSSIIGNVLRLVEIGLVVNGCLGGG
jgi:hypothetical protein